jgi:hypothetical protein
LSDAFDFFRRLASNSGKGTRLQISQKGDFRLWHSDLSADGRIVCLVTNIVNPETLDSEEGKLLSYLGHARSCKGKPARVWPVLSPISRAIFKGAALTIPAGFW